MSENTTDAAVLAGLTAKYEELAKKRKDDRELRDWLTERLRDTHREMINLVVTARMFGGTLPFPEQEPGSDVPITNALRNWYAHRQAIEPKPEQAVELALPFNNQVAQPESVPAEPVVDAPKVPKIKDAVLEILRIAGDQGVKAGAVRRSIESTHRIRLHEKTVGMTLYRLSQSKPPLARREGFMWFFVPSTETEKKNPGGETPGPSNVFD